MALIVHLDHHYEKGEDEPEDEDETEDDDDLEIG
jgi:hypothetical protein